MRSHAGVRLALCFATVLSVGASFGLHPEPADPHSSPAQTVVTQAAVEAAPSAHGCLACLTHGAALSSPLPGIVLSSTLSLPAWLPSDSDPRTRLAGRDLSGRSPPSRS